MSRTILALTRYNRLGASSRVRVLQYLSHLEREGLAIDVQPLFDDADLKRLYKDGRRPLGRLCTALMQRLRALWNSADVVWLQQEIFPFLPFTVERTLLKGRKLVIDFDDAQHLYYARHRLFRDKIAHLMRRADVVVVGNPMMGDYARAAGASRVELVYSAVDTASYPQTPAPPHPFTVGWIGTPMTAAQSLHLIREPLARFLSESGAHAIFIGMEKNQFPELAGERIAWSEEAERAALPRLSVGLCPLEDNAWTRGKSGYKIIQYMAAGKPALTSPVGIAAQIVEDGRTGFHCLTPDDWYRRLHQLSAHSELTAALGAHGRLTAESKYDTRLAAAKLRGIFEDCLRD